MAHPAYAELHCHTTSRSSTAPRRPDELVERAVELGLAGLAVTDHQGLYGVGPLRDGGTRRRGSGRSSGSRSSCVDAAVAGPGSGIVVPARRARPARRPAAAGARAGRPTSRAALARASRTGRARRGPGCPAIARRSRRTTAGSARRSAGRTSCCSPGTRRAIAACAGWSRGRTWPGRRRCRGSPGAARRAHARGWSRCRAAATARSRGGCGPATGTGRGRWRSATRRCSGAGRRAARRSRGDGFVLELSHHLLPDDDWLVTETARLAERAGAAGRRDERRPLRPARGPRVPGRPDRDPPRPDARRAARTCAGRTGSRTSSRRAEMLALPPGDGVDCAADPVVARAWAAGIASARRRSPRPAGSSSAFEQLPLPGLRRCRGARPRSRTCRGCAGRARRRRYHPMTSAVVEQLAHELDVIERTGLAEFFLICWDLMRFAKERGSRRRAGGARPDSIVAYVLGITPRRSDPPQPAVRAVHQRGPDDLSGRRHRLLAPSGGRRSSSTSTRRYGPEHTGMVCNLVTYRARSAVREVGYALGFPRPLVDRVAKALETYDSVMVRRDLEAEGGFAEFFARPGEEPATARRGGPRPRRRRRSPRRRGRGRGLTDAMGQLNHPRGGRFDRRRRPRTGLRRGAAGSPRCSAPDADAAPVRPRRAPWHRRRRRARPVRRSTARRKPPDQAAHANRVGAGVDGPTVAPAVGPRDGTSGAADGRSSARTHALGDEYRAASDAAGRTARPSRIALAPRDHDPRRRAGTTRAAPATPR